MSTNASENEAVSVSQPLTQWEKSRQDKNQSPILTFFLIWSKNLWLLKCRAWKETFAVERQSSLCVRGYVRVVRACSETWGWAGSLLSLQTGEVFWRGGEAAYRLSHCVTHTDAVWDSLFFFFFSLSHKLPRTNLFARRKWALVL